jgi:hypothetical protein
MTRSDPQIAIRLPPDVREFIRAEARENSSSQNSEVVRAIRERMKAKGPASAPTLPSPEHDPNPSKEQINELTNE